MDITPQQVRDLLSYDLDTGVFTWRERGEAYIEDKRARRVWNEAYAGTRAGTLWTSPESGYQCRKIKVLGKNYREHRLAWLWVTGEPAPKQIDHKNRDATDNRWDNLRGSDSLRNGRNISKHINNTSGVTGVSWSKAAKKWFVQCRVRGKHHYLGVYDDIEEAARVIKSFRDANGFDKSHGKDIAHYHAK